MSGDTGSKTLQTTATSTEILELLEETDGAGVTEIANRLDLSKSTVHGHLATLEAKEFVIKRGSNYYLGPELLRLGNEVRTRKTGYVLAREYTERLFERVGFRSTFAAEMGGQAVFIHTASGNKMGWAHEQLGNRLNLHSTALGKAILASMPRMRVEQILDDRGLPKETEHTITDRDVLFNELEVTRERGYAVNHEENLAGLYAIGAAATEKSGSVIGGFSISGPEQSFTGKEREQELADVLTELVNEYELDLSLG